MNRQPYTQVQIFALECPRCRQYHLIQSEDPYIYYICPDIEGCGYVIWARPPSETTPVPNIK